MARILIVDDSMVARMSLSNIIKSLGHTVVGEASNGMEAIEKYSSLKPDIVTMDLTMDGCDGVQATTAILDEFPNARIVVISARQENRIIIDALEHGARHFIIKPVSPDKIRFVLNNVLQQNFDRQKQAGLIRRLKRTFEGEKLSNNKQSAARVLIVDDSAVSRRILREIVTDLGHEVIGEAVNGAQAFVEYINLQPDLVTMDLTMEGLGGAEAISKIISVDSEARIVVISSLEVRQGIINALERGARHFIVKPIHKEKVATVLNNVLNQEFDLQKHIECVRRLREEAEKSGRLVEEDTKSVEPPYAISVAENNLVHIFINQSITLTSCQTLFLELEEHLRNEPRVLLDFGKMSELDEQLLVNMNELIKNVERNFGLVKAVSNNREFVDEITSVQFTNEVNYLGDILRYWQC